MHVYFHAHKRHKVSAIVSNPQCTARFYGTGMDKSGVKKQSCCSTDLAVPVRRPATEK